MEAITEEDVFTFEQLSDDAKEKARDWMRDLEMEGGLDTEFLYEDFQETAEILGISFDVKEDLRWSGFSSQGDGASFKGSYSMAPNSCAKIREARPEETALHAIADGLHAIQVGHRLAGGHWINAKITQGGNCVHEYSMDVETLEDSETGEELEWNDGYANTQKRILELMRDFARYMYKCLEAEWDYRLSDEAIDDTIRANDYKFNEDGEEV